MPGPQELIVIAIVALLVFGPDRLPELIRGGAKMLAKVRNEAARNVRELRDVAEVADIEREIRQVRDDFRGSTAEFRRAASPTASDPSRTARSQDHQPQRRPQDRPPPTDPEAT